MKIAVINFSGNVGKTTISRHLLMPRIPGAELIAIESINADESHRGQSLRGRQFGELQEYMQTVNSLVVDIGASNVEDLMALMRRYRGSHEDFDFFVVPTVAARKQQQDTMATLAELSQSGIPPERLKVIFNMVDEEVDVTQAFALLLAFLKQYPVAQVSADCRLGANEIYGRVKGMGAAIDLVALANDSTDYKSLITKSTNMAEKLALAQALATRRLACGVVPQLDACFAALALESTEA